MRLRWKVFLLVSLWFPACGFDPTVYLDDLADASPDIQTACGNGAVEPGEGCDDGNLAPGDGCDESCTVEPGWTCSGSPSLCARLCGNGRIDASEQCDGTDLGGQDCTSIGQGFTGGTLRCTRGCRFDTTGCISPNCGDGKVNGPNEECDDGNTSNEDDCLNNCKEAACGDGYVWSGHEECDDGGPDTADCDSDCTAPACGDGHHNPLAGEECDTGGTDTAGCDADCTLPQCGDGHPNSAAGEACDEGGVDTADCDSDCTAPACGDGHHNPLAGEECDTGGTDTAGCDADCTLPQCGDGHVNEAAGEECDDGGTDTAGCDADCTLPQCGDGHVNGVAGEECDDGNMLSGDGCSASCEVEPFSACRPADSSICHCVVYVDDDGPAGGDGSSWQNALTDLQAGIDEAASRAPCHVWVAEGTYGTQAGFVMASQVSVYGSFAPGARWYDERSLRDHPSILDGDDTAQHVVLFDQVTTSVLNGFDVRNGANTTNDALWGDGGGILVRSSQDVTVSSCYLHDNVAADDGGGIGVWGSTDVTVTYCWIQANSATDYGGGIHVTQGSQVTIFAVVLYDNTASMGGNLAIRFQSTAEVVNSFLASTAASRTGHNLYMSASAHDVVVRNSDLLVLPGSTGTNAENVSASASLAVANSILWGSDSVTHLAGDNVTASYSDVQNQADPSLGVFSADPSFVDPRNGNFELAPDSPCIDAGDGDAAPATDAWGRPRYDDPNHPNGVGNPPYVDLGHLEYQGS